MIDDGPLAIDQGPGLPAWTPKNFNNDYLGMMTLRAGLEKSRNLVTIRLSQEVGMGKIVDVTKRLAIHPSPPRNPAMVLGTTEATLLTMTHAYSMIANGGYRTEISLVDYVQDRYGRTVWRAKDLVCQGCDQALPLQPPSLLVTDRHVIDPRTSYQMISLLEGVIQRGTGQRARGLRRYFAGKTGTTNGPNRSTLDSWFIGFTAHTAIGVYVGYDQPRNLGIKESGATVALPIVTDFLLAADSLLPDVPFPVPDGIVFRSVDPSTGSILSAETKLPHTAIREAFKAEFLATETTEPSSDEAYKKASENPEITPLEAQQLDQAAQNEILAPSSPITAPTASSPATDSTDTKDTSDRSESADGPSGFY
jgi:penicillin-binding protein 1A